MTAPTEPDTAPQSVVEQHDAVALALEIAAAVAVAAALQTAVGGLQSWVQAQWGVLFGVVRGKQSGPVFDRFRRQLVSRIRALPEPDRDAAVEYARRAYILGVVQGYRETGVDVPVSWLATPELMTADAMLVDLKQRSAPGDVLREASRALDAGTRSRLSKARRDALDRLDAAATQVHHLAEASLAEVSRALAGTQTAGTIAESTTRAAIVETLNQGIKAAAGANGARVFWIAERDACRWCASLSGTFPSPDGEWHPHGFGTPGPAPYRLNADGERIPLTVPPMHPHCRCRLGGWRRRTMPGPDSYPARLRREAQHLIANSIDEPVERALRPTGADTLLRMLTNKISRRRNR